MMKLSSSTICIWTKILFVTSVLISVILVVDAADEYEAGQMISTSSLDARRTPPNRQSLRRRTTTSSTNMNMKKKSTNVQCGDFLDTDVTLFEDLDCNCERGPGSKFAALTVVGPASLDLNNFSVRCENDDWDGETDLSAILKVVGRAGVIKNGNISRGNFGIVLAGYGHHTVQNVKVTSTANDGLQINAPFCEVTACDFRKNGNGPDSDESGDAIDIGEHSQYSVVQGNTMTNYGDDGLSCRGDYNIIRGNTISIEKGEHRNTQSEDGITIYGEGNQIIGNTIRNTYKDGIDIKLQGFNILRSNTIMTSKDGKGIKIGSNDNFIVFNTVESMTDNAGFNIEWGGNRNYLADNISNNNGKAGFKIEETNNNVIVRNTATGNNEEGFGLAVKKISGEVRGLAHIVAGNIAQDNAIGRDFQELGNDSLGDCTQNAYIGNRAPTTSSTTGTTAANPSCMLGAPIDLSLQDDIPRTNAPTNKPTNKPTELREECENKKKYLFENKPGKTCNKWAAKGNHCTKQDTTDEIGRRVSFFCPLQCNPDCIRGECENKKQYLFENKPGRDCDTWAAKRNGSNRCKKEDTTDEKGRLVSFFCPLQCNTDCFTPVPSAMPSSSPSSSPTNAPTNAPTELREGCENKENYLFENKVGKDCDKWATEKKHCTKQDTTDAKGRRVSSFCPLQCNTACSTPVPTVSPSNSPSPPPSSSPSVHPSESPSVSPNSTPSSRPNSNLSSRPSTSPSSSPSREPSQSPNESPSSSLSGRPSSSPSSLPSSSPSNSPSVPPNSSPSVDPSESPSGSPSSSPSSRPSSNPSSRPSASPSSSPSDVPSASPSSNPSSRPSTSPSSNPSAEPL